MLSDYNKEIIGGVNYEKVYFRNYDGAYTGCVL